MPLRKSCLPVGLHQSLGDDSVNAGSWWIEAPLNARRTSRSVTHLNAAHPLKDQPHDLHEAKGKTFDVLATPRPR